MGDYNIDLIKHEIHQSTKDFLDILYANYLIPLTNRHTEITKEWYNLIDNMYSNEYNVHDYHVIGIKGSFTVWLVLFLLYINNLPRSSEYFM